MENKNQTAEDMVMEMYNQANIQSLLTKEKLMEYEGCYDVGMRLEIPKGIPMDELHMNILDSLHERLCIRLEDGKCYTVLFVIKPLGDFDDSKEADARRDAEAISYQQRQSELNKKARAIRNGEYNVN